VGAPVGPLPSLVALLDELGRSGARLKLVRPENLHTTIAFLGDVPDDATSRLSGALDEAVKGTPPLAMRLRGVGAFPSAKRARVVWCGVADPAPLAALAARARERLAAAGFAGDEKDFRAHVTLARSTQDAPDEATYRFLEQHGRDELGEWRLEDVRLFQSVLGPHGPTYTVLHAARLEA